MWRVLTVPRATASRLRSLLRLLLPPTGRHRAPGSGPAAHATAAPEPRVPAVSGEDIGIVRPYVLAHEHRVGHERRLRRRARLVVAPRGVDLSGEAVA